MRTSLYGALVLVFALAGGHPAAAAQTTQTTQTAADQQIASRINERLFDAGLVTVKAVVEDGQVTLSGPVETLADKDRAVKEVRKVKGVTGVTSTLTVREPESDSDVAASVSSTLRGATYLGMFDEVGGIVRDGVATLTGFVTSPDKARRAAEDAADVPGIQKVVNQIEVLPASTFDDQIRLDVANRIYNEIAVATMSNANARPIHIIVKNGHVRLVGVVPTEMDKKMAAILARQVTGVSDVDNALTVG